MSNFNERPPPIVKVKEEPAQNKAPVQVIDQHGSILHDKPGKLTKKYEETPDHKDRGALIAGLIQTWPNYDVWPFKYGVPALGLVAAGTAGFLNKTFRNALVLDRFRLSTYVGLMAVSGLSSVVWHYMVVTSPILENRGVQCPICLQVKSAAVQLANGVGYPLVLAPVVSYVIASSFKDRHLPKIYSRPGDVLGYTRSVFKPIKGTLGVLAAVQVILPMALTYFEQEVFYSKILPVVDGRETLAKKPSHLS